MEEIGNEGDDGGFVALFEDPEDFYSPPPQSHTEMFMRKNDQGSFCVRLPPNHSLWAHMIWNASRHLADWMEDHPERIRGRRVLELGAGGAIPSLTAVMLGASRVVMTDYPNETLLSSIRWNVDENVQDEDLKRHICVMGHLWGENIEAVRKASRVSEDEDDSNDGFDLIIMSDLIFNHIVHEQLLLSAAGCIRPGGEVLVTFSHHKPHLAHRDLNFFVLAKRHEFGNFHFERVNIGKYAPMFEEDRGPEDIRSTVFFYRLIAPGEGDKEDS